MGIGVDSKKWRDAAENKAAAEVRVDENIAEAEKAIEETVAPVKAVVSE